MSAPPADKIRVTLADAKAVGYCNRGGRAFAERHGLDWHAFVFDGLPAAALEATGDAMALKAVAHARARQSAREND